MSRASKLTLLGTSLFAVTTIFGVHFQQKLEKNAMHEGVVRDMEQQRIKRERQLDFDLQKALEAEYRKDQTTHNSVDVPVPSSSSSTPQSVSPSSLGGSSGLGSRPA